MEIRIECGLTHLLYSGSPSSASPGVVAFHDRSTNSGLVAGELFPVLSCPVLIDGSNPAFIRSLKIQLNENPAYETVIARYKDKKINWQSFVMKVLPINFNQEHKAMLSYCKMLLENGYIAINPVCDKLVISLRTAIEDNGILDKETTSYNDAFDAFRLALRYYRINQGEKREERKR